MSIFIFLALMCIIVLCCLMYVLINQLNDHILDLDLYLRSEKKVPVKIKKGGKK